MSTLTAPPLHSLNCMSPVLDYLSRILQSTPGMKALLLDADTMGCVSLVHTQTDLIANNVFLVERIDALQDEAPLQPGTRRRAKAKTFHHLKALVFIRPVAANLPHIRRLLHSNKYKDYHVYLSALCPGDDWLRELAACDDGTNALSTVSAERIRCVHEMYADYFAPSPIVWHTNQRISRPLCTAQPQFWLAKERAMYDRQLSGVLCMLLSHKRRPDAVCCAANSDAARQLASDAQRRIHGELNDLFTFSASQQRAHASSDASPAHGTLLLVLDRRNDPLTPLLSQWTYQAMLHQLLTLRDNRIDMSHASHAVQPAHAPAAVGGDKQASAELVLSPLQDAFYARCMYLNFGDLGCEIKRLVQAYQATSAHTSKLDSVEDMQRFVDNYAAFRAQSGSVSKHVQLMTELSRLVEQRQLMRVSELEQTIACHSSSALGASSEVERQSDALAALLDDAAIDFADKLRCVAIYALRHETAAASRLPLFKQQLRHKAHLHAHIQQLAFVDELLAYAGTRVRSGELFGVSSASTSSGVSSLISNVSTWVRSGLTVKGCDNVFTQHKPLLSETLQQLAQGRLARQHYASIGSQGTAVQSSGTSAVQQRFALVYVYMLGGCTYEEALAVETFNAQPGQQTRVLLGGSCVHNADSFVEDVLSTASKTYAT